MAIDVYLQISGIAGEANDIDLKMSGAIDVHSYSFGVQNPPVASSSGGADVGTPQFTDLSVVVPLDKATPPLLLAAASGQVHPTASLRVFQASERSYEMAKVDLTDVVVTSVHQAGSASDDRPTNEVSLRFQKVAWTYRPQNPDGSLGTPVTTTWDLTKNAPS